MTRPEDVALLRRVADLLPQLSYGETARELRSLASRLEGERRDGERMDWLEERNAQVSEVPILPKSCGFSVRGYIDGHIEAQRTPQSATPTTPTEDRPS